MTGLFAAPTAVKLGVSSLSLIRRFWPVLPILALIAALLITRDRLADAKARLATEISFGDAAHVAAREASGNPALARRETAAQIVALGRSLAGLQAGLAACTGAAKAAADSDRERQRAFEARARTLDQMEASARSRIDRLRSSAASAPPAATCEPSAMLREIWQ